MAADHHPLESETVQKLQVYNYVWLVEQNEDTVTCQTKNSRVNSEVSPCGHEIGCPLLRLRTSVTNRHFSSRLQDVPVEEHILPDPKHSR